MILTGMTYAELDRLLLDLGFKRVPTREHHIMYRHLGTDTHILLPQHDLAAEARASDVAATERILEERGIIGKREFLSRLLTLREVPIKLAGVQAQLASYRQWSASQQALIDQLQEEGNFDLERLRFQLKQLAKSIDELEVAEKKLTRLLPGHS